MTTKSTQKKNPDRNKTTDQSQTSVSMIETNSFDFIFVSFRICVKAQDYILEVCLRSILGVGNTEGGGVWRVE